MMIGSFLGVIANIILPDIITLLLLCGTLLISAYVGFKEANILYEKENKDIVLKENLIEMKNNDDKDSQLPLKKDSSPSKN